METPAPDASATAAPEKYQLVLQGCGSGPTGLPRIYVADCHKTDTVGTIKSIIASNHKFNVEYVHIFYGPSELREDEVPKVWSPSFWIGQVCDLRVMFFYAPGVFERLVRVHQHFRQQFQPESRPMCSCATAFKP